MYDDSVILDFVFPYTRGVDFDRPLDGAAASADSSDDADEEGRQGGEAVGRQDRGSARRQDRPGEADNNEGDHPNGLIETIARAERCCAQVPERVVSEKTAEDYRKTFKRMLESHSLDPFAPGMAFDTFYHRRAALHYGGVVVIRKLVKHIGLAVEQRDEVAVASLSRMLEDTVSAIEVAFERDPPGEPNALPWEGATSRFRQLAGEAAPERGANSKKHALAKLDKNWDRTLWKKARELKFEHLLVLAVKLTVPVRPEDMVPGDRPSGYSSGVILNLIEPNRLEITVKPCKSHSGRYGTESTTITVDPTIADEPAKFLAQHCHEAGGHLVVGVPSKNTVRKAIRVLGEKAFGKDSEAITPSVLRNQIIADLKATFGGGEKVAAASGQLTDRTQSKYGFHQHGRRRKGYVAITSARVPRTGNVARAIELSKSKVPDPET